MLSILSQHHTNPAWRRIAPIRFTAVCVGRSLSASFRLRRLLSGTKNFALAMPYLVEQGFSRGDLGFALSGISIAYGFSKFIMGSVSDRSNPRVFLPAGLIMAALVMLVMGFVPWATSSIMIMFTLLFVCGWFQGMGWPPCGRTMVHWWSQKERGGIVSVWNCAHNVGGGIPTAVSAWYGPVQRLEGGALHARVRRNCRRADCFCADARYAAVVRSAAD